VIGRESALISSSSSRISGWLFDIYPLADKMIFWIKQKKKDGSNNSYTTIRLENNWTHSIYVAANDKADLKSILLESKENENIQSLIKDHEFVSRYEKVIDTTKSNVLKLTLLNSTKASTLARRIERLGGGKFGKYRLYNVDIQPAQSYFYEHDIFPLALSEIRLDGYSGGRCSDDGSDSVVKGEKNDGHSIKRLEIRDDSIWSTDYETPNFKAVHIEVNLQKESKIPKYSDRINSISIKHASESFKIECGSEADLIKEFVAEISKIDPDFIFTEDGDSFTFPYLIYRAEQNDIQQNLILSREKIPLTKPTRDGISYFSYGRVYFKPTTIKLHGRIHFDISNSFILNDSGLYGLYEIARVCRMPLHTTARASIGKCLSSLQCYYATRKGILIPWKPFIAEHFKNLSELFIADRGGFIFEPKIGVHEQVAEFDFESLYPNIMRKYNLSAETIRCNCCDINIINNNINSNNNNNGDDVAAALYSKLRVPELGYNICQRRIGIVPTSLKILLNKRAKYKELRNNIESHNSGSNNSKLKAIYDARYSILKWVLVTSFGYLGFNNAKFGRIDAHIAVCAFDRQVILQTAKIAERRGFRILHGIVDSIWVKKEKEESYDYGIEVKKRKRSDHNDDNYADYLQLKKAIGQQTGFKVSFEGIYKWIAFVSSKQNDILPVPNRYFGAFEDGNKLKIRGIEARRHDTPPFFSKFQNELLEIMASGSTINEVIVLMPKVRDIFQKYVRLLKERNVPLEQLIFTKRLSKDYSEYQIKRNTVESSAINLLHKEGKSLKAGELLRYIITDFYQRSSTTRAIPIELIDIQKSTTYDIRRYAELLAEMCNSVTESFKYTLSLPIIINQLLPMPHFVRPLRQSRSIKD
jgi:DNA polymerase-2